MFLRKIFRKAKDPLDASTVPGTRSVNNFPLIIGGTVVALFLAIIAYVMTQRTEDSAKREENKAQSTSATRFAAEVAGPWGTGGLIPPDELPPEPAPIITNPAPAVQDKKADTMRLPPLEAQTRPTYGPEENNIRNMRMQAFHAGLTSKTGVQAADIRGRSNGQKVASPNDDSLRRQMGGANDTTATYQSRLAQLRGDSSGNMPTASSLTTNSPRTDNSMNRFSRGNKWELQQEVEAPASPYELRAGFVIPAIMLSGINSNLPGQVMAQVSQNVYDTATGRFLLVPQGTRLIGTYNSDVGYGQERILMAWQRLIFPDGKALDIEAMPGADSAGMAGFEDQINNHYIRTFSSAFLLSGVIAAVSMSQQQSSGNYNSDRQRAGDAMSEALGQTLGTTMAEMIKKNLNIAPTLEIRPGYRFNVMVTKDMRFKGPYTAFDYQ